MDDDEKDGIRGRELAQDAGGPGVAPNAPADGGLRGDGLAEGPVADVVDGHEDGLAQDGVRGEGLADDA